MPIFVHKRCDIQAHSGGDFNSSSVFSIILDAKFAIVVSNQAITLILFWIEFII